MQELAVRVRSLARRLHGRILPGERGNSTAALSARGGWAPRVTGKVEKFGRVVIEGWVAQPVDGSGVEVTLAVRGLVVARTQAVPAAGPASLRRFRFLVRDLWDYLAPTDTVVIRANGSVLPVDQHGMHAAAGTRGRRDFAVLRELVGAGWVFSKGGRLQLAKSLDHSWRRDSLVFADRVGHLVGAELGLEWFTSYGALLGAVRASDFLDHDNDIDLSYISATTDGPSAAAELSRVAHELIERGLWVRCLKTHLSVRPYRECSYWVDLFHVYFDEAGVLRFPFGVAGTTMLTRADWQGTRRTQFADGALTVPVNAEQVVETLYGSNWRRPDPGFAWWLDRSDWATAGHLPDEARAKVYWANFWSHLPAMEPSSFWAWTCAEVADPVAVIDLGCGAGRDACAFAASGRPVLGVDLSPAAVRRARSRSTELGLGTLARFEVGDVGDQDFMRARVAGARAPQRPLMFYGRFLLHAVPAPVQDALLQVLGEAALPGDLVALEFRTNADAALPKTYPDPIRRFQDGPDVVEQLVRRGFEVVATEEGRGLAPYGEEDPELYRVFARRTPRSAKS